MPELDEELTEADDGASTLDDELVELESGGVDVVALAVALDEDDAATPGMVSALTVPRMPTPATAAKATEAVMLLSSDKALSRARIRASPAWVPSIVIRVGPTSQSPL